MLDVFDWRQLAVSKKDKDNENGERWGDDKNNEDDNEDDESNDDGNDSDDEEVNDDGKIDFGYDKVLVMVIAMMMMSPNGWVYDPMIESKIVRWYNNEKQINKDHDNPSKIFDKGYTDMRMRWVEI